MKPKTFLIISIVLFICGCSEDTAKLLSERYNAAMVVYHETDPKAAEEALVSLHALLVEKRQEAPGAVNYDELEGIVNLRLYGLYESTGRLVEATDALQHSVRLLHRRLTSATDDSQRKEQLKALLIELEREFPPKWKLANTGRPIAP